MMEFIAKINIIDVAVVIALIFFSYRGYVSGFINILFDSLAIIVSFYAANKYSLVVNGWMAKYLKFAVSWSGFVAYILTYLASFVFFVLWGRLITKIFQISPVGIFNNVAGLVLNFLKWTLLIFIVLVLVSKITISPIGAYLINSFAYKLLNTVYAWDFFKEFVPTLAK